jgi:dGTPase
MSIRERLEEREQNTLSEYATLSINSRGRQVQEDEDDIRTCFMVDRDRIIHSKAFRRLKGKTQVFISPLNDHYMTRMTHTLETAQVARTIAAALGLNETLAEAIMLAHDTNHSCFGHAGEEALDKLFSRGFNHEESVGRRLEYLEKRGKRRGLNLSWEVLDGAVNHSGLSKTPKASTMEGKIAPFADKVCYLVSDMENAINAGIIEEVPRYITKELGNTKGHMLDTMIKDIIKNSDGIPNITMSDRMFEVVSDFRKFMFKNVYFSKICRDQANKAIKIINDMYGYLLKHPEEIPVDYDDKDIEQNIVDYISSMTDQYAINLYRKFFFIQE